MLQISSVIILLILWQAEPMQTDEDKPKPDKEDKTEEVEKKEEEKKDEEQEKEKKDAVSIHFSKYTECITFTSFQI